MKYLIALLCNLMAVGVRAQTLTYSDNTVEYKDETVEVISVKLSPSVNTIRDKFEEWMDDNYDVNLDGRKLLFFDKEVMTAKGVVIPQISDKKIDLLVKVNETDTGTTILNVFASWGYNNWITEDGFPSEYSSLQDLVYNFVATYLPEYYEEKIDDREGKIADLSEDRSDLKSEIADNEKKLAELRKENQELLERLKSNQLLIRQNEQKMQETKQDYNSLKSRLEPKK